MQNLNLPLCEYADPFHKMHQPGYSHPAHYIAEIKWYLNAEAHVYFLCKEAMGVVWDMAKECGEYGVEIFGAEEITEEQAIANRWV